MIIKIYVKNNNLTRKSAIQIIAKSMIFNKYSKENIFSYFTLD